MIEVKEHQVCSGSHLLTALAVKISCNGMDYCMSPMGLRLEQRPYLNSELSKRGTPSSISYQAPSWL